jgi:sec-independent protein translocase protein TatB
MLDFSWSEIMVIGVVALVLIGPKDMPVAIRAITRVVKRMRRMAGEFQGHVDEMMRDAEMGEVSDTLRSLRGMNLKSALNKVVDGDGTIRRAFADPLVQHPVPPVMTARAPVRAEPVDGGEPPAGPPPAFIPPAVAAPAVAVPRMRYLPPDFVPPAVVRGEPAGDEG